MFSEGNHETVGDKSEIGIKRRAGLKSREKSLDFCYFI